MTSWLSWSTEGAPGVAVSLGCLCSSLDAVEQLLSVKVLLARTGSVPWWAKVSRGMSLQHWPSCQPRAQLPPGPTWELHLALLASFEMEKSISGADLAALEGPWQMGSLHPWPCSLG